MPSGAATQASLLKHNNIILLAANKATYNTLAKDAAIGASKVLEPDTLTPGAQVIIESGINSADRQPTRENRDNMVISTNLLDLQFNVKFDSRFVSSLISVQPKQNQSFANNTNGSRNITLTAFARKKAVSATQFMDNYVTAVADGLENLVLQYTTDTSGDATGTNLSQLGGPRGGMTAMSFAPSTEINAQGTASPSYYTLYGRTGVAAATLGFTTGTYDYIDTTIYVQGLTTGASMQLPVRIVRQQA